MQIALTTKQRDDESVRDFAGRVEANVTNAEIQGRGVEEILLSIFLGGVKSEYAKRLNAWGPGNFETAVSSAIRYEDVAAAAPKKESKPLYAIIGNERKQNWDRKVDQVSNPNISLSRSHERPSGFPATGTRRPTTFIRDWSNVICYHCGEKGHGYSRCDRATPRDKQAITVDFPNLVSQTREQNGNPRTTLNLNSGSVRDSQLNR